MHQIIFRLGLCPRPHWEAYSAPKTIAILRSGWAPGERVKGRKGRKRGKERKKREEGVEEKGRGEEEREGAKER